MDEQHDAHGETAGTIDNSAAGFAAAPQMDTAAAPPLDGLVPTGTGCARCGYSLEGLSTRGACPECGLPTVDSLLSERLADRDAGYLATLRRGVTIAHVSILMLVVVSIVNAVISMFSGFTAGAATFGSGAMTIAMTVGTFAVQLFGAWGWWLLTTRDPGGVAPGSNEGLRRWVRRLLVCTVVMASVGLIATVVGELLGYGVTSLNATIASGTAITTATIVMLVVAGLLSLLGFGLTIWQVVVTIRYVGDLARRLPDAALAKRAKFRSWFVPVIGVVGTPVCYIGPLVALILYYNLLIALRKRLTWVLVAKAKAAVGGA